MNINRHNYEEFFLLYVDNELSAAERKAVELFVQENADLKEELHLLQQTVMNVDTFIFDNKGSLLKEDITALQENLLLYIDNELSPAAKKNTEELLSANTTAKNEWQLLQQTIAQPDTAIVFKDKDILYRKEKGRVVALPWRRVAAAAILLGFGTWGTISYIKTGKPTEINSTAANSGATPGAQKQPGTTVTPAAPVVVQPQTAATNTAAVTASATAVNQVKPTTAAKNNQPVTVKAPANAPQQQEVPAIAVQQELKKPSNNLPKPDYNNFNKEDRNENITAYVPPANTVTDNRKSGNADPVAASNQNLNNGNVNGYALNANYTEGDDDNNVTSDDKGKKSKLGGFFRKVKRMVERTTNVKTGNGIKVAGFDIAIK